MEGCPERRRWSQPTSTRLYQHCPPGDSHVSLAAASGGHPVRSSVRPLTKGGTTLANRIDSGYNPTDFDAMREDRFWQAAEIGFGGLLKEILARNVIPSVNEPEGEMR